MSLSSFQIPVTLEFTCQLVLCNRVLTLQNMGESEALTELAPLSPVERGLAGDYDYCGMACAQAGGVFFSFLFFLEKDVSCWGNCELRTLALVCVQKNTRTWV